MFYDGGRVERITGSAHFGSLCRDVWETSLYFKAVKDRRWRWLQRLNNGVSGAYADGEDVCHRGGSCAIGHWPEQTRKE